MYIRRLIDRSIDNDSDKALRASIRRGCSGGPSGLILNADASIDNFRQRIGAWRGTDSAKIRGTAAAAAADYHGGDPINENEFPRVLSFGDFRGQRNSE